MFPEMIGNKFKGFLRKYRIAIAVLSLSAFTAYWFCLPEPLFHDPVSTILLDRNKEFLSARIAADGQWRFSHQEEVPDKFKKAIICFEDKRFYSHPGVDPIAIGRALRSNLMKNEVVSGGSTLSMQVIRLSRKSPDRTILEKIIEMIQATRLEISYSKEEILALYTSNAPFGGNVVGLETAAWKYFGRSSHKLSWAEAATLAVLPNCPGLIHPGRNRETLKKKRDKLLDKLFLSGEIDSLTCVLSKAEALPGRPLPLPDYAPHLAERIRGKDHHAKVFHSTLDINIQKYSTKIVQKHYRSLKENTIHNAAALVIETETGNILAYVGNSSSEEKDHGQAVDMITAPRSTGSILKPLLYAMMLNEGYLLPHTLVPDVPTWFGNYTPKNFDLSYQGAVPASIALSKSLNIPSVHMLHEYGIQKFHRNLKLLGMTTLAKESSHYGLSFILGGAETTLEDIAGIYAGMGRTLQEFQKYKGKYDPNVFRNVRYDFNAGYNVKTSDLTHSPLLDAGSVWHTFEAMTEVMRPAFESNWESFSSSGKIAWKTGTSFGFRDAWAIGCTPQYTVAVWVGNANGEGRPGITGIDAAAPLLLDIINGLNKDQSWFTEPKEIMPEVFVCKKSGHRASEVCRETEKIKIPKGGLRSSLCPYHKRLHLDETGMYQVNGNCYSPFKMTTQSFFILPPVMEQYYKSRNPDYITAPDFLDACEPSPEKERSLAILYPLNNSKLFIPVNLDGSMSKVVLQATHPDRDVTLYWHLDDTFIGETKEHHELAAQPSAGEHTLTIITSEGELLKQKFSVLHRNDS